MNKILTFLLTVVLYIILYVNSFSQNRTQYNLFSIEDKKSIKNIIELEEFVSNPVVLSINKSELINLCDNKNPEISLTLPYVNGSVVKLNLARFEVLASDAKIISRTQNGNEEVSLSETVVSYKGSIEGLENTLVVINFTKDNVIGLMSSEKGNYILGSLKDNGHETDKYILYKETDLKVRNTFNCSTSDQISTEDIQKMRKAIIEQMNDSSPTDLYTVRIAIDVDFITYGIYGNVQAATNYALTLMAAVSAIYIKEINVNLAVSYLRVWTIPDPYIGTNASTVLNRFKVEWNANQQSVQRTIAHLISSRPGNLGGIAHVNVLCDPVYGYGFSNTDGTLIPLPLYSWNIEVLAHEIGHNFGSNHTHNCSWVGGPIDTCAIPEGACYPGPAVPRIGTIMSYCMDNGSVSFILGFGPQPRAFIRTTAQSAPCISVSTRPILVGYPNGGENFNRGKLLQIYWGSSLIGNVNIELSLNNGLSWQTIQNNVPASDRKLNWAIPYISTTNQARIRVLNSSNTNSGDTSDASFTITDTYLNPLEITIGIEGFWNGITQVSDTVRLYFRNFYFPYNVADSCVAVLNSSGNASAGFSNAMGGYYYIQVQHRNTLEAWSSYTPLFIPGVTTSYNFALAQSLTYGNNSSLRLGRWCLYSGDVNKDGIVDASDLSFVNNAVLNSLSGYHREDVSGDNYVDAEDLSFVDNNVTRAAMLMRP